MHRNIQAGKQRCPSPHSRDHCRGHSRYENKVVSIILTFKSCLQASSTIWRSFSELLVSCLRRIIYSLATMWIGGISLWNVFPFWCATKCDIQAGSKWSAVTTKRAKSPRCTLLINRDWLLIHLLLGLRVLWWVSQKIWKRWRMEELHGVVRFVTARCTDRFWHLLPPRGSLSVAGQLGRCPCSWSVTLKACCALLIIQLFSKSFVVTTDLLNRHTRVPFVICYGLILTKISQAGAFLLEARLLYA